MDAVSAGKVHLSTVLKFEEKAHIRAEKHEHLRGRNNTTSCRSPTRDSDTKSIKNELKEKRQREFLRRRSVSPEMCGSKSAERRSTRRASPRIFKMKSYTSETVNTNIQNSPTANGHLAIISETSDAPSTSKWASLWSAPITKSNMSVSETQDSKLLKRETTAKIQKSVKTIVRSERVHPRPTQQSEHKQQKMQQQREASVQTKSGFVTVEEADLQRLADYLQEALWREEALKKKLAALQESTTNLMNSSDKIWTTRCNEDLLKNKIRSLEAQLQVFLQKFPKDAVKKLLLQMERQKLVYEDKAVIALQKVTEEKTEALTKAETLQEALNTAKTEAQRWQSLYEELRLYSVQLKEKQHHSIDDLQQLHSQLELSRVRETELQEELVSLKQHNQELRYNICLLEENNDVLREEIQDLRDGSSEMEDVLVQQCLTSEETEQRPTTVKRASEVEEQLQLTLEKLRLKEKECVELQTELSAMEQECQSSQVRLSQCRDQLRQMSVRRGTTPTGGGSCLRWCLSLCLLVLFAMAAGLMLWLRYPPFREQLEDLYADIKCRVEDYLMEMASPRHSGRFRPV